MKTNNQNNNNRDNHISTNNSGNANITPEKLSMASSENKMLSRRKFLKIFGLSTGAMAVGVSCSSPSHKDGDLSVGERPITGEMTYRVNHNTGDKVSILGYGCMRYPMIGQGKDAVYDEEEIFRLIDHAMEHGVNYYDTSPVYCRGLSEEITGRALSRHPRQSYFIATKLSNFDPSTWPHDKSVQMFQNSLKNLQTDYIDYLLLHSIGGGGMDQWNARFIDNGILDYLKEQKKKGVIRNLGFSYHGDVAVFYHLLDLHDKGDVHWDFVQIQMNYADWLHANTQNPSTTNSNELYEALASRNIPVVIMEPLLGGRLASQSRHVEAQMRSMRPNDSTAAWAFRYAGSPEGVLTVLSGMTYMDHLNDNLATYSPLDPITPEEKEYLENAVTLDMLAQEKIPCTACQYCMPCPYGIDIPGVFDHYNKCLNEDSVVADKRDPNYAQARKRFLLGYDRQVNPLRQASQCIGCEECLSHCPQNIRIPKQMRKIDSFTELLRTNPPV